MEVDDLSEKEQAWIRMAANQLKADKFNSDRSWERVQREIKSRHNHFRKRLLFRYAAIVILFITSGLVVWLYSEQQPVKMADTQQILPIVGKPELILTTGERVLLDSTNLSRVVKQPGVVVTFDSTTYSLQYQKDREDKKGDILAYNELRIPKGGEYTIILADGTRVWLNAESSLRYPVQFASDKREVFLEGEACFEVTRNEHSPFLVRIEGKTVEVLGTVFNISAYPSDTYWHTTLASGKVKIDVNGSSCILLPSEQYIENKETGEKEIRQVDASQYLSWRIGKICFRGERLEDIIQKLGRWYDFQIFYANDEVRNMRFRGVINKYDAFDVVLRKLEQTTDIHFEIKGNTVIVNKIYSK